MFQCSSLGARVWWCLRGVGVRTSRPSLRLAVPFLPRFACSQLEKEYDTLNTHAKQLTSTVQTVLVCSNRVPFCCWFTFVIAFVRLRA